MKALRARLEALKARPRGLTGSAFTMAPGDLGKRRSKYPLPKPFNGDPRKLQPFLTVIKGYYLKYNIRDKEEQVRLAISLLKDKKEGDKTKLGLVI